MGVVTRELISESSQRVCVFLYMRELFNLQKVSSCQSVRTHTQWVDVLNIVSSVLTEA